MKFRVQHNPYYYDNGTNPEWLIENTGHNFNVFVWFETKDGGEASYWMTIGIAKTQVEAELICKKFKEDYIPEYEFEL